MIIKSINPANGKVVFTNRETTEKELITIHKKLKIAQKEWSKTSINFRIKLFKNLKKILQDNKEHLSEVVLKEAGKLKFDFDAEFYDILDSIDYYINELLNFRFVQDFDINKTAFPSTKAYYQFVPLGVVGLIMPWNFPFYTPMIYIISNILAGNTVLFKPSEYSTQVGIECRKMFLKAGFPKDIFHVVIGNIGRKVVKLELDKIFFVGSVATGKNIISNAGITPVQIEAGGNSAAIVLDDADLDLAASGILWGATYHSGQDCVGIKRVIVIDSIYDKFVKLLLNKIKTLRPCIDYGPYIAKEAMQTVSKRIKDSIRKGNKLIYGGNIIKKEGNWLEPSIIEVLNNDIDLIKKETFGNVIPLIKSSTIEKAIEINNSTNYGL